MPSEPITLRAWVRGSKASQAGGGTGGGLERVYQRKERPGADRSVGQGTEVWGKALTGTGCPLPARAVRRGTSTMPALLVVLLGQDHEPDFRDSLETGVGSEPRRRS